MTKKIGDTAQPRANVTEVINLMIDTFYFIRSFCNNQFNSIFVSASSNAFTKAFTELYLLSSGFS